MEVTKGLEVERRPREGSLVLTIFDHVFVREIHTCDNHIEVPYYSSENFAPVCAQSARSTTSEVQGQYLLCSS